LHLVVRYVTPVLIAACGLLAACERPRANPDNNLVSPASITGLRGTALAEPLAKPAFVLTRADGTPYDFARETNNKVTLLFFGYTHCPDVCPLHMANIAAVLKKMPWGERNAVRVVFVTTDPERDTPDRIREWLAGFDPSFVGLRGEIDDVNSIQQSLGFAPATRQASETDSALGYLVSHAAQVIAFGRDNIARVVYPFGTRQDDWAHDLPRLTAASAERAPGVAAPVSPQPSVSVLERAIAPAVIAATSDGTNAALYLTILNSAALPDTLRAVSVIGGADASLHVTTTRGGSATMQRVAWLEIPAKSRLEMQPGGTHAMLAAGSQPLTPGHTTAVELHLARGGRMTIPAAVVTYAQLDSVLALVRSALGTVPR
jgi:cytochrome oxidase Cu insertion factor (SCO1/SenC/PrrC family)/copper(I)-binding protein